jgi:hypothetical protein
VLFHFEIRCQGRWEAVGAGEGGARDSCVVALADLNALAGGSLPAGSYRCLAATSAATHWETLLLAADGQIRLEPDASAAGEMLAGG